MPYDRREFLLAVSAAAVACKSDPLDTDVEPEPAAVRDPGPDRFEPDLQEDRAIFPWSIAVGDPTPEGVMVMIRANAPLVEAVLMRFVDGQWSEAARLPGRDTASSPSNFEVTGLDADRAYAIYAEVDGVRSRVTAFRTAPPVDSLRQVRILATSCLGNASDKSNLQYMAEQDADALLLLGDTIYADGAVTHADYEAAWEQHLSVDRVRDMFASTGVIATWDDHEVDNNWVIGPTDSPLNESVTPQQLEAATAVWRECVPMRLGPSGSLVWRSMRWGATAEIFVLDCRGERSPGMMMSDEQLDWFVEALQASEAVFKIVLSSIHVTDHFELMGVIQDSDRWQGYPEQRARLITAAAAVPGTLFITGDMHYGAVQYIDPIGGPAEDMVEVAAGPAGSTLFPVTDVAAIGGGTLPDQYSTLVETWSFCTLDLDPGLGTVAIRFVGDSGEVVAEHFLESL